MLYMIFLMNYMIKGLVIIDKELLVLFFYLSLLCYIYKKTINVIDCYIFISSVFEHNNQWWAVRDSNPRPTD